jgi:hypothetical protein
MFLGKAYSSLHLTWNYVPLWIAITTPPLYLFLFVVGSAVLISRLIREPWIMLRNNPQDLVGLIWFFGPLLLAILANVNLYDGYRHLYFIYPALIYIALAGLYFMFNLKFSKPALNRSFKGFLVVVIAFNFLMIGRFFIRHHPYQNVYLNFLAGRDAHRQFDIDYWGLAYIKAYKYLLNNITTDKISIAVPLDDFLLSISLLTDRERNRLQLCIGGTQYFITNYLIQRNARYEESFAKKQGEEIYLIQTERAKVLGIYELYARSMDDRTRCLSVDSYLSQPHLLGNPVIE